MIKIRKTILIFFLVIVVGLSCIIAEMNSRRLTDSSSQNVSPLLLTMGGFRNIISDIMMVRLQYLIDDNDFLEVQYLSELVNELNPDSAKLTIFNAWNLAYNITIIVPDQKTRWYFLNSAIELLTSGLTDENSKKNAQLRYELATLYLTKLSEMSPEETFYTELWNKEYGLKKNAMDNLQAFEKLKMNLYVIKKLENIYGQQDWRTSEPYIRYNAFMAKDKIGESWQHNIKILLK